MSMEGNSGELVGTLAAVQRPARDVGEVVGIPCEPLLPAIEPQQAFRVLMLNEKTIVGSRRRRNAKRPGAQRAGRQDRGGVYSQPLSDVWFFPLFKQDGIELLTHHALARRIIQGRDLRNRGAAHTGSEHGREAAGHYELSHRLPSAAEEPMQAAILQPLHRAGRTVAGRQ